jgi:hypothetical protein
LGGWDPSLNTKYISYIPYTHSLKVILYNVILCQHCDCILSHEVWCGIFHLQDLFST